MKDIFKINVIILFVMLFIVSACEKDDFTGKSTLNPTAPTLSVTGIPSSISFVEKDSTFTFEVTMSMAQTVNVKISVAQIDGTATEGEDFKILTGAYVVIPAGSLSAKVKVQVLSDNVLEGDETFSIQIGNEQTANATFAPVKVDFTIQNTVANDLSVDMSWTTNVLDIVGIDESPTTVVDMRLLITDDSGNILAVEDGAGAESYSAFDTLPDGTYKIATDIYSTMNYGDVNAPITLSFVLDFNQSGVINGQSIVCNDVMTNEFTCDSYRTYFATVTKSGSNYTITKAVSVLPDLSPLAGSWKGLDPDDDSLHTDFASQVIITYNKSQAVSTITNRLKLKGLAQTWMTDFRGEIIIIHDSVDVIVDWCAGTLTIPSQPYMTTTRNDTVQSPYNIKGTGVIDVSGVYPSVVITYDLIQAGVSIAGFYFKNGDLSTKKFVANLTLDPAGLPKGKNTTQHFKLPIKH